MTTRLLEVVALIGLATLAYGQSIPGPDVPDAIKVPVGEELVLQARASGVQIYACRQGTEGKIQWVLAGPEAQLHDRKGSVIGRHYAGPTWKLTDGSEVRGKAIAQIDSPDAGSIPWLLVTATTHSGNGALTGITSIQRIHTRGGQAPSFSACNASRLDSEVRSNYTADYYFYAPAKTRG